MRVRRATLDDIAAIHEAHMRSIREICSGQYTPEQIHAWGERPFDEEHRRRAVLEDFVWVVERGRRVEGFGHMEKIRAGRREVEILGLYLTKNVLGQGLGKCLLGEMEQEAKANGILRLRLFSTLTARQFYESQGFRQLGDVTFYKIRGVPIACFAMDKTLQ